MAEHPQDRPPSWANRFLRWFCRPSMLEDLEGDLNELYSQCIKENPGSAKRQYIMNVLKLFRPGIIRNLSPNTQLAYPGMLKNYWITSLRHSLKNRSYSLINILGLVVGISSSLIINLWVNDELDMDQFHTKGDRLYLVYRNMVQSSGEINTTRSVPQPLQKVLEEEYPEVEKVAMMSWPFENLFEVGDLKEYEEGRMVTEDFFELFSYPIIVGNKRDALAKPSNILLSENLAEKYFGMGWRDMDSLIGSRITLDNEEAFQVAGIFENPGSNSSWKFDFLIPATKFIQENEWLRSWYNGGFRMYLTLNDAGQFEQVQKRIYSEVNDHTEDEADEPVGLQKFSDRYLYGTFENGVPVAGRMEYVRILRVVSIFLVLISAINFLNITTARSGQRVRETALRKVFGSYRSSLRFQFLFEAFLSTLISLILAVLLVQLIMPLFINITGRELSFDVFELETLGLLVALLFSISLLAAIYPLLVLPGLKISDSIKGLVKFSWKTHGLKKGLVVFQFGISIFLIIGSMVISDQVDYIMNKNLGLDKENLIMVELNDGIKEKLDVYRAEIERIPEVSSMTTSSGNPLSIQRSTGGAKWEGKEENEVLEAYVMIVGDDFIETQGMEVLEGRTFSSKMGQDTSKFLINETAKKLMGLENPVNSKMSAYGIDGHVIGVIKNFHMASLYDPIEPLIILYDPNWASLSHIKVRGDLQQALAAIEGIHTKMDPDFPFDYSFMDQDYEAEYKNEMMISTLARSFTVISIFLSCLGLFGLSAFSASQRTREIGIRKVLGANVSGLMLLLTRGYIMLILLALILTLPLAYYYSNGWLENFSFRTNLGIEIFLLAGLAAILIGTLTVSIKSFQAANANPVDKLRTE